MYCPCNTVTNRPSATTRHIAEKIFAAAAARPGEPGPAQTV